MDAKRAELKAANLAAREIRFYAKDMLHATGTLTPEHRAIKIRQANALRAVLETDDPQELKVDVYDVYQPTVVIGWLTYTF